MHGTPTPKLTENNGLSVKLYLLASGIISTNMTFPIPNILFLFTLLHLTSALFPNITATPHFPGTCQGWPGYMTNPIGNLTQQFFFEPRDTSNSSLDGLRSSLSSSSPSQLIASTDPTIPYNIFSCIGNGLIFDIHGGPTLVFSTDEQDQELGYPSTNDRGKRRRRRIDTQPRSVYA